jgi:hypothetical protein
VPPRDHQFSVIPLIFSIADQDFGRLDLSESASVLNTSGEGENLCRNS